MGRKRGYLDERDKQILEMRLEGMTLAGIGEVFGITRERVRQLEYRAKILTGYQFETELNKALNEEGEW